MNSHKFTQKTMEAITKAQSMAIENQNIEILPEHLLYALLDDESGLIASIIKKCGVDLDLIISKVDDRIRRTPRESKRRGQRTRKNLCGAGYRQNTCKRRKNREKQ